MDFQKVASDTSCPQYRTLFTQVSIIEAYAGRPARLPWIWQPNCANEFVTIDARGNVALVTYVLQSFDRMFVLGDPPDYEQPPERSVGARARARGVSPSALAYDLLLEQDGTAMLYFPFLNYAESSLEPSLAMMKSENTVLGLGDGGAHLGTICDASFTTHMLTHWTRDRTRGEKLPVETVVRWHARDTARAVGLCDRGVLAPGYRADLNVIDYGALRLRPPHIVRDLPAGGRRLVQEAVGYRAAIVAGGKK